MCLYFPTDHQDEQLLLQHNLFCHQGCRISELIPTNVMNKHNFSKQSLGHIERSKINWKKNNP